MWLGGKESVWSDVPRTCLNPLTFSRSSLRYTLMSLTVPAMSYTRFMRRALVSSSIEVMPKRWRSGVKVILVHSSPFLFSVI